MVFDIRKKTISCRRWHAILYSLDFGCPVAKIFFFFGEVIRYFSKTSFFFFVQELGFTNYADKLCFFSPVFGS
uniref:26S proteasome non-ATPase regulatory subunit 11 homolog n=1 Tax=Rhizophora mucronata TaxID=61149 RepID=A0A2P2LV37_RHIMU